MKIKSRLWGLGLILIANQVVASDNKPSVWQALATPIEDRQAVMNEWLNDEAPHKTWKNWPLKNSKLMAIAQGSHLWVDRANKVGEAWQDQHSHPDAQWTDVVLEGKAGGKLRYFSNLNVTAEQVTVDEAYVNFAVLPLTQLKIGQFYSAVGRLNSQHPHDRDFIDAPVIYQRLFGDSAMLEKGFQVNHLLSQGLVLGVEGLTATNRDQFASDRMQLNTTSLFGRWALQMSPATRALLGASLVNGEQRASDGRYYASQWAVMDLTLKYDTHNGRYWLWQSEFLSREANSRPTDIANQSGYYTMLLYRWHPQWRVGLRDEKSWVSDQQHLPDQHRLSMLVEYDATDWLRTRWQIGEVNQSNGLSGFYFLLGWQASFAWQ